MKTRWSDDAARIFALLGNQPIAYHPALGRLFGIETSLVFVQSLWFQSDADQRGAESWSIRDSAFADRIGFTHEQLRRHIRPLLDSVTSPLCPLRSTTLDAYAVCPPWAPVPGWSAGRARLTLNQD